MLDIKEITKNPERYQTLLRNRDPSLDIYHVVDVYREKKKTQVEFDKLRHDQRLRGIKFSESKKSGGESEGLEGMQKIAGEVSGLRQKLNSLETELEQELLHIPNIILPDVPISQRKEDKVIVRTSGNKPIFDFPIKDHLELAASGIIDFKRSAKIAGTAFPLYVGKGARLEWALINFMVDHNIANGYNFVLPPLLNNKHTMTASGNLPKFRDQLYACADDDLYLIPTSEVPLTSLHRDEVLSLEDLPLRYAAFSPNFRREGDLTGRKNRGLMRMHQFHKIETYSITTPEQSIDEHKRLVDNCSSLLDKLGLHYRVANLPSCDLAQQSAQTFDTEIWLPYDKDYSEVSSASNCLDYQARRANIRYKNKDGSTGFVHTLNCSSLATPRVMVSLLESNQTEDGRIIVPEILRKYTGFESI